MVWSQGGPIRGRGRVCVDGNLGGVEGRGRCQAGSEVGPKVGASTVYVEIGKGEKATSGYD